VYVGRRNMPRGLESSPLANRHHITGDCDRNESIRRFRLDLWASIKSDKIDKALDELERLMKYILYKPALELVCWCSPLPCHGEIIAKALKYLYDSGRYISEDDFFGIDPTTL
jgi:hypothetical protein